MTIPRELWHRNCPHTKSYYKWLYEKVTLFSNRLQQTLMPCFLWAISANLLASFVSSNCSSSAAVALRRTGCSSDLSCTNPVEAPCVKWTGTCGAWYSISSCLATSWQKLVRLAFESRTWPTSCQASRCLLKGEKRLVISGHKRTGGSSAVSQSKHQKDAYCITIIYSM